MGKKSFAHNVASTNFFPHYLITLHKGKKEKEEGW